MSKQFDAEEEYLDRAYRNREISAKEYQRELCDLRNSYMAAAEDAAREAYERELERW